MLLLWSMELVVNVIYHEEHSRIGCARVVTVDADGVTQHSGNVSGAAAVARFRTTSDGLRVRSLGGKPLFVDGERMLHELVLTEAQVNGGVVLQGGGAELLHVRRHFEQRRGADGRLLGNSAEMSRLRTEVSRVAEHDIAVLILGESGTGKELVAEAIHRCSARAAKPLVRVNMAAIPASMAAGELFGHRRGAFTGAASASRGYFGAADGGTLLLDEIGDTPSDIQSSLLRALSCGEVQPVGAPLPEPVDVRVIAATDADVRAKVERGELRLPLLMRLGGYEIHVPPLRERREDIALLFVHFLRNTLAVMGAEHRLDSHQNGGPWLPLKLFRDLLAHPWPGNVRELRNFAQRVAIACADRRRISDSDDVAHLFAAEPAAPPLVSSKGQVKRSLRHIDGARLERVLHENDYQPSRAARELGISRTSLYVLIARHASLRKASDLAEREIERALEQANLDVCAAARALTVSERGLRLRMRALGMNTKLPIEPTIGRNEQEKS